MVAVGNGQGMNGLALSTAGEVDKEGARVEAGVALRD